MKLYRLSRRKYAKPLNGRGASLSMYNRWNSKGTEIIYTSENKALTILEVLVHMNENQIPNDYVMVTIDSPDSSVQTISTNQEITLDHSQDTGDKFVNENKYLLLRVPSIVVPGEYNVLINPFHPNFEYVTIEKMEAFEFDWRLF